MAGHLAAYCWTSGLHMVVGQRTANAPIRAPCRAAYRSKCRRIETKAKDSSQTVARKQRKGRAAAGPNKSNACRPSRCSALLQVALRSSLHLAALKGGGDCEQAVGVPLVGLVGGLQRGRGEETRQALWAVYSCLPLLGTHACLPPLETPFSAEKGLNAVAGAGRTTLRPHTRLQFALHACSLHHTPAVCATVKPATSAQNKCAPAGAARTGACPPRPARWCSGGPTPAPRCRGGYRGG